MYDIEASLLAFLLSLTNPLKQQQQQQHPQTCEENGCSWGKSIFSVGTGNNSACLPLSPKLKTQGERRTP